MGLEPQTPQKKEKCMSINDVSMIEEVLFNKILDNYSEKLKDRRKKDLNDVFLTIEEVLCMCAQILFYLKL